MAKFGSLTIDTVHIKDGELTTIYQTTGDNVSSLNLTVTTVYGNPTQFFIWADGNSASQVTLTRTRGSKVIGQFGSGTGIREFAIDDDPQDGDVYTLSNLLDAGGAHHELSAFVAIR